MIHYLDRTFCCRGDDCTCPPGRRYTEAVKAAAEKAGLPVALGLLCNPEEKEL